MSSSDLAPARLPTPACCVSNLFWFPYSTRLRLDDSSLHLLFSLALIDDFFLSLHLSLARPLAWTFLVFLFLCFNFSTFLPLPLPLSHTVFFLSLRPRELFALVFRWAGLIGSLCDWQHTLALAMATGTVRRVLRFSLAYACDTYTQHIRTHTRTTDR